MTAASSSHRKRATAIEEVLSSMLGRRKWRQRVHIHSVFSFWNKVVGDDIAIHAQPDIIRGNVLWLKVSDQVWMHQLHLQKNTLLRSINDKLDGRTTITDIRFRVDLSLHQDSKTAEETTVSPPPAEEVEKFKKMIDSLEDDRIKESLLRLWVAYESKLS